MSVSPNKESKHKVGDTVKVWNKKARIKAVHANRYSPNDPYVFYTYDIEWLEPDNSNITTFNEQVVSAYIEPEPTIERACQCGAWAVPWASEHHSHWCPEANLKRVTMSQLFDIYKFM